MKSQVLYAEYSDLPELGRHVRTGLPQVLRELDSSETGSASGFAKSVEAPVVEFWSEAEDGEDSEGDGALDFEQRFTEAMGVLTSSFQEIGEATRDLAQNMQAFQDGSSVSRESSIADRKRYVEQGAEMLEGFNKRLEPALARLTVAARDAPSATKGMVSFLGAEVRANPDETRSLLGTMAGVTDEIARQVNTIGSFREVISNLPRMTKSLNEARRRCVRFLDAFLSTLQQLREELLEVIEDLGRRIEEEGESDPRQ